MINCNRRDGTARAVNEVAERLARRHEVHLFARTVEDLDLRRIRWHRVPGPGWPEVADFTSYQWIADRMIRPGAFDVVHGIGCNSSRANVITIQNIQPAKTAAVGQITQADRISTARRFTRILYLRLTSAAERRIYSARPGRRLCFLPVSCGVEAELRAHYPIGDALVRIVPNAADIGRFQPPEPEVRLGWRMQQGYEASDCVCLFTGGEWRRKGLDLAIQAIGLLADPAVHLYVAGEDPAHEQFVALAQECGVGERVRFGGFREDVERAMGGADLFLFPSHYEAFSLATIEAAACGLPVVASRINGTEDFIRPGETGAFIPHDPAGIAAGLRPLTRDPALRKRMGDAARRLVESRYTWDRVAEETEAAYLAWQQGAAA